MPILDPIPSPTSNKCPKQSEDSFYFDKCNAAALNILRMTYSINKLNALVVGTVGGIAYLAITLAVCNSIAMLPSVQTRSYRDVVNRHDVYRTTLVGGMLYRLVSHDDFFITFDLTNPPQEKSSVTIEYVPAYLPYERLPEWLQTTTTCMPQADCLFVTGWPFSATVMWRSDIRPEWRGAIDFSVGKVRCVIPQTSSIRGLSANITIWAALAIFAFWLFRLCRHCLRARRGRCTTCGYLMIGLPGAICPECGEPSSNCRANRTA